MLRSILESHDDLRLDDDQSAVKQLFHGRTAQWTDASEIRIGPVGSDRPVSIRVVDVPSSRFPVTEERARIFAPFSDSSRHVYVSPNGLTAETAARLWDLIALTDLEQDVTDVLKIISADVERISFIGESGRKRVPMAKLSSENQPVALRSLGDGVNRLLGIALSLAYARGGVLLIDEVENGVHFSAQQQMWRVIFRLSHRLATQVFATTHSWDCIEAFQQAAAADPNEEAALVRLDVHDDAVSPTSFSERELAIVTRDQIEVR